MKHTVEEKEKMINLTDLKGRGWTNSMVTKLLPEPMLFPNPIYKCAAPMKKWRISEVEQIEQSKEFRTLLEKAKKRRAVGKKTAKIRQDTTLSLVKEAINDLKITVWSKPHLEKKTLEAKQDWAWQQGNNLDVYSVSIDVLSRWEVNFIRHNLTNYEQVLSSLFGMVGNAQAYALLKPAILNQIGESYPYLKDECNRQIRANCIQPPTNV